MCFICASFGCVFVLELGWVLFFELIVPTLHQLFQTPWLAHILRKAATLPSQPIGGRADQMSTTGVAEIMLSGWPAGMSDVELKVLEEPLNTRIIGSCRQGSPIIRSRHSLRMIFSWSFKCLTAWCHLSPCNFSLRQCLSSVIKQYPIFEGKYYFVVP